MWIVRAREVVGPNGEASGRWRMTALSDEDGGGPYGDTSHDHPSPDDAIACERCDDFVSGVTGFPTRRQRRTEVDRQFEDLADRFLAWELPESVCSDACATQGGMRGRVGTNLLTRDEAVQMFRYVLLEREPKTA